jgi:PKD repeat protein
VDGRVTSYYWSFGDGQSGYGATVSHLFATGTFIVRLVAYDSGGAWGMTTASVAVVNPVPAAAFTWSCSGFTCTFNSSGSTDDGPLRFSWIFGHGGADNYNANPSHRYYAPGTNQVTLTVADMVGQTATFTDTVNVNPERMHVGDLDGSRTEASRGWWYPTVTVTVHGADDRRLLNVLVTGRWSTGEIASCWTDAAGQCSVTGPYARGNNGPSFTVENLSHEALAYGPSANHDPDGDSNGTTLSVTR